MQKHLIESNPLLKLTLEFSLLIINYCDVLNEGKKYVIGNQLLRAGTSVGANAFVAQNCESKADFVHKIKIAAKEAEEMQYWLMLCQHAQNYPGCSLLEEKLVEIQNVLNKILISSKRLAITQ